MEEEKKKTSLEQLAEVRKNSPEEKFEPEKFCGEFKTKRKITLAALLSAFFLLTAVFASIPFINGEKNEEKEKGDNVNTNDFEDLMKGRLVGNIVGAMNISKNKKEPEYENPVHGSGGEGELRKQVKNSMKNNKNIEKDREILENYSKLKDAAEYEKSSLGHRRRFVPGGENQGGGVFVKEDKKKKENGKSFAIHNLKVRTRLDFSIRSTAKSTVVATVIEDSDIIPKGAKFYGNASGFANKRTQLSFSKLIVGKEEFTVKGFAVSGKDPGIESEVTDISDENIKSDIKQGFTKTAGSIVAKLAGNAGSTVGTAALNTVNPVTSDLNQQEENNKMKQEYRVPAGTSFFVYIE